MTIITYDQIKKLADNNEVRVKHYHGIICEVRWKTAGIEFSGQFDSDNKGIYGIQSDDSDKDQAVKLLHILANHAKGQPE